MAARAQEGIIFVDTAGYSMWPFIRPGEKIVVKRVAMDELNQGDVILYREDGELRLHRLIRKTGDKGRYAFYSRGDNSNSSPEFISEEMYIGKAVAVVRKGKMINFPCRSRYLQSRGIIIFKPFINTVIKPLYRLCLRIARGKKQLI
jgi:signal peptidase I